MSRENSYATLDADGQVPVGQLGNAPGSHPDLAAHNTLGLATQAELDAHATATHAATQAAAEATAAAALSGHAADTTAVHGITDTAALVVDGDAAGGQLSGTYPDPTVAASHSGSTHAATQAAAEATAAGALATHEADGTAIHGIADTSVLATGTDVSTAVSTHAGLADPHTGYRLESADHSHASTGLQAGTVAHTALTSVGIDDHHARDHAINGATHTGTLDDAQIPAGITRDAEAAAAYAAIGHTHAGVTFTTVEVSLGSAPIARRGGHFTIAGTGMTVDKPVSIQQAVGPYTGKGTRFDEVEMDLIRVTAKVRSATVIDVYWQSERRVRGNYKFDYVIGG